MFRDNGGLNRAVPEPPQARVVWVLVDGQRHLASQGLYIQSRSIWDQLTKARGERRCGGSVKVYRPLLYLCALRAEDDSPAPFNDKAQDRWFPMTVVQGAPLGGVHTVSPPLREDHGEDRSAINVP